MTPYREPGEVERPFKDMASEVLSRIAFDDGRKYGLGVRLDAMHILAILELDGAIRDLKR